MIARGARLALHIVMLVASSSNGGNAISARALVRITRFRARVQVECTNTRRTLFTTILFAVIVDSGLAIVASAFQIKLDARVVVQLETIVAFGALLCAVDVTISN